MAFICNDRVKETTATTGTGTITLAGAVTHFEAFSAIGNTNTTYYCIVHENTSYDEWEVGYGVYTLSGTTLTRTAVTSSNGDALVSFTAGTKSVFCTLPANKCVIKDTSGNLVYGDGTATGFMTSLVSDTTPQLGGDLDVNGNAIVSASDGDIAINANGTGMVTMTANSVTGDVIPGKYAGTNFSDSLLVGHSTSGTLSTASGNTGVGIDALDALTSGDNNVGIGFQAGSAIAGGSSNVIMGKQAGDAITSGGSNVAIGALALSAAATNSNVGVGAYALHSVTGSSNVGVGQNAGVYIAGGDFNICLGQLSGDNITSGSGNVVIGKADVSSATGDDQLSISDGEDGAVVWMTGESTGNVEINEVWNPSLSTTGKALVFGF